MTTPGIQANKVWKTLDKIKFFQKEPGSLLPEGYKKFWQEWRLMTPTAVHYIPKESKWERNEITGEVFPVQNIPIPIKYPPEHNLGIWGGEGVVKGFQKRTPYKRRVPHFWVPVLKRTVLYSEILNKYMAVTVTDRTIRLIHENYGFDHYLLKTPACDLKSLLALTLKRKILQELSNKCPAYTSDPLKKEDIYERYKEYLTPYTAEDIEWYGYTLRQACEKLKREQAALNQPQPLKHKYRLELLEKLKAANIQEAQTDGIDSKQTTEATWLQKINIFGKKHET